MTEFAIGDVVRLKTGGPHMTITRPLDADGEVCTTWSEGEGDDETVHHRPFLPAELTLIGRLSAHAST